MGLEMVGPSLKYSMGIFLGVARVEDGTGKVGHEVLSKVLKNQVGSDHNEIDHTSTSDRVSKGSMTML